MKLTKDIVQAVVTNKANEFYQFDASSIQSFIHAYRVHHKIATDIYKDELSKKLSESILDFIASKPPENIRRYFVIYEDAHIGFLYDITTHEFLQMMYLSWKKLTKDIVQAVVTNKANEFYQFDASSIQSFIHTYRVRHKLATDYKDELSEKLSKSILDFIASRPPENIRSYFVIYEDAHIGFLYDITTHEFLQMMYIEKCQHLYGLRLSREKPLL